MSENAGTGEGAERTQDELSGEVSVMVAATENSLSVGGKSRFLSATDRLLGGIVGVPAAYIEGFRKRIELRNEAREALIREHTRQALEALHSTDVLGRATAERFISEELRKQLNREAVWLNAVEAVKALPPPSEEVARDEERGDQDELDPDWINMFASYVDKASTERMQQLWGDILAGEIRKPGSFAPSTLRVISEMDAEIAQAFQEVVGRKIPNGAILMPDDFRDQTLFKYNLLEEVGLLQEVNNGFNLTIKTIDKTYAIVQTERYYLQIFFPDGVDEFHLKVIRITRVGQQIASILPWDEVEALRELERRVLGNFRIVLGRILTRSNGDFQGDEMQTLREFA
jgi:hypothetical protein